MELSSSRLKPISVSPRESTMLVVGWLGLILLVFGQRVPSINAIRTDSSVFVPPESFQAPQAVEVFLSKDLLGFHLWFAFQKQLLQKESTF